MRLNGRLLNMRLLNAECEAEYEADCVAKYEAEWEAEREAEHEDECGVG